MIKVLSLGAGVQSTTVLLLSIKGQLPALDHAIFADTGWEPPDVYRHLEWLQGEATKAGVPVHTVRSGNIKQEVLEHMAEGRQWAKGGRHGSMPFFTSGGNMVRRTCTREYKVDPITRFMRRELLKLKPRQRAPKEVVIHNWFGISHDEVYRMRESAEPWKLNVYPLVGMPFRYLKSGFTRRDCEIWLNNHYPGHVVPRSACIGCPFHSNAEWRKMKQNRPKDWNEAVAFDKAIRKCRGMTEETFLHRQKVPLDEVDLRTKEDMGQGNLFASDCEGMCGV